MFNNEREGPLLLGSVKTNVGHSEAASGITSIIKATLMLETATIPPTHGLRRINPKIRTKEWNVRIVAQNEPWPRVSPGKPRRVSINSVRSYSYLLNSVHYTESLCSLAMAVQMPMLCWRTLTTLMSISTASGIQDLKVTGHSFYHSLQRPRMDC